MTHLVVETGDVDVALSRAHVVVDERFSTPFVDHCFLGPEAGVAVFDEWGSLTIWSEAQDPFDVRRQVSEALGMPVEKVRLINMTIGGAFGGKVDVSLQIFLALGALHTGRPVKMIFSRQESLRVHPKRHAFELHYRLGADTDGKLAGIDAEIIGDTGAYASFGKIVLQSLAAFACGPYAVPNSRVSLMAVYTNNPPAGAFRGFGVPQVHVALESQMDEIARRLGIGPFELRLLNALEPGSTTYIGHKLDRSVGFKATLKAVQEELQRIGPEIQPTTRHSRVGIGVAGCFKSVGFPISMRDWASAIMLNNEEGGFVLHVALVDLGQGSDTAMAQIAAEELEVPVEWVHVAQIDTDKTLDAGPTVASRMTYLAGNAVQGAARKMRDKVITHAADLYGIDSTELIVRDGWIVDLREEKGIVRLDEFLASLAKSGTILRVENRFVEEQTAEPLIPVRMNRPLAKMQEYDFATSIGTTASRQAVRDKTSDKPQDYYYASYSFGTQAAVVEVNELSGRVKIHRIIAAFDVGRAIHPQNVEGQIEGSTVMGMGTALSEELRVDQGHNLTDTLSKCGLTRIRDVPEITSIIIEDEEAPGPFGAKGIGEVSIVPTAPAILNGIYDAVGLRMTRLPVTPKSLRQAMQKRDWTDAD